MRHMRLTMPEKLAEDFPRGKLISRGEKAAGRLENEKNPPRASKRGTGSKPLDSSWKRYTMPWAIIASATFLKPAMLAPAT